MRRLIVVSVLAVLASASSAYADEVIKTKLALGCAQKDVAKTVAAEMVKYVDMINNQNKVQFTEDCEVFVEGDAVVVVDRPKDEAFVKAQRPAQIKAFWIPASAIGTVGEEKKEAEKK